MMVGTQELKKEMEKVRGRLNAIGKGKPLTSEEIVRLSQKFDKILNEYFKQHPNTPPSYTPASPQDSFIQQMNRPNRSKYATERSGI